MSIVAGRSFFERQFVMAADFSPPGQDVGGKGAMGVGVETEGQGQGQLATS